MASPESRQRYAQIVREVFQFWRRDITGHPCYASACDLQVASAREHEVGWLGNDRGRDAMPPGLSVIIYLLADAARAWEGGVSGVSHYIRGSTILVPSYPSKVSVMAGL